MIAILAVVALLGYFVWMYQLHFGPPRERPKTAQEIVIINRILRHPEVQLSTILGAICAYLLIGMVFGFGYALIARIDPPFFANHGPVDQFEDDRRLRNDFQDFLRTTESSGGAAAPAFERIRAVAEALGASSDSIASEPPQS